MTGIVPELDEFFKEAFRSHAILPVQSCEDRSLDDTELMSLHYDNRSVLRDYDAEDFNTSLHLCYKIIKIILCQFTEAARDHNCP